ncbi:hypothetical protein T484DRAFT_3245865 [Baffinella frigidus]|nr:hypothetical protein T484DRAFT_3245865 [Cryptophyta sp. CCMP2293]
MSALVPQRRKIQRIVARSPLRTTPVLVHRPAPVSTKTQVNAPGSGTRAVPRSAMLRRTRKRRTGSAISNPADDACCTARSLNIPPATLPPIPWRESRGLSQHAWNLSCKPQATQHTHANLLAKRLGSTAQHPGGRSLRRVLGPASRTALGDWPGAQGVPASSSDPKATPAGCVHSECVNRGCNAGACPPRSSSAAADRTPLSTQPTLNTFRGPFQHRHLLLALFWQKPAWRMFTRHIPPPNASRKRP